MTKKDYELIASGFKYAVETTGIAKGYPNEAIEYAIACLVMKLEADNPRFDKLKFRIACGLRS